MDVENARSFGRFRVIDNLGRNSFATVYLACDNVNQRVVLKVLHLDLSSDAEFVERFYREAQIARGLQHPNIATVYEVGEHEGQLYVVSEYVSQRTLDDWLRDNETSSLEDVLPILDQLAEALDYAHEHEMVHRDVKPSNVILEERDDGLRAVLVDFGLTNAMSQSAIVTSLGVMLGSPEYMAPEQANPDRADEIGRATDRYALGVLVYRMLAGRAPFTGNSPDVLRAHEQDPPPAPHRFQPDLSEFADKTILKMLAKQPDARYPSARAFVDALRRTLDRYQVEGILGSGAFATVHKAYDTKLRRFVALKVLHPQLMTDPRFVARFRQEAWTAAGLKHPHIIDVYDVGEFEGRLCIMMQLANGQSLKEYIKESHRLSWQEALDILDQIASALDYAHQRQIVHRDIKPSNIFLDREQGVLLGDFGLSKVMGASSTTTSSAISGTLAYVALEIWDGKEATPASDVYALACVFYEMVTGEVLFGAESPLVVQKLHNEGTDLHNLPVADEIRAVLLRGLARSPEERYQRASDFAKRLREAWRGLASIYTCRRVDVTIASDITVGQQTALCVQARLPDAPLQDSHSAFGGQGQMPRLYLSEPVVVEFPGDYAAGQVGSVRLEVLIDAPDLTFQGNRQQIIDVPYDRNSDTVTFHLTAEKQDPYSVGVRIHTADGTYLGTIPVEIGASANAAEPVPRSQVVSLLLFAVVDEGLAMLSGLQARAEEAAREKRWDDAIALLAQVLQHAPDIQPVRERLAQIQQEKKRAEQKRKILRWLLVGGAVCLALLIIGGILWGIGGRGTWPPVALGATATPTVVVTQTPAGADTPLPAPTLKPSEPTMPASSATATKTVTSTPTPTRTSTPTPTATVTPTATATETFTPSPTPTPHAVVIGEQGANLRAGPGKVYDDVGGVAQGGMLTVLARTSDSSWLLVEHGDAQVWIFAGLVEVTPEVTVVPTVSSTPPPPTPTPTHTPTATYTPTPTNTPRSSSSRDATPGVPPPPE
jgi:serine/threonine protein kinase